MRCNVCGYKVESFFDHIAYDCEDWPEKPNNRETVTYKGYEISRHLDWPGWWQWVHKGYDGPEDQRAGSERTYEDCLVAVEERTMDE